MEIPQVAGGVPWPVSPHPAAREIRRALYENAPFIAVVGLYVLLGTFILRRLGPGTPYEFGEMYQSPALLIFLYLGVTGLAAITRDVFMARRRPSDLETWRRLFRRWLGIRRLVGALVVLLTLPALLDVMLGYRLALPDINPFQHDHALMILDRALHLGRHPWEWLQPVLGHPAVTIFLDRTYVYGWFGLQWIVVLWQAVHGREPVRLQFLLCYAMSWILLGTIAAVAFSSVGPVYYGRVTGLADPYAPLMAYLQSVDVQTSLHALANQERLWDTYRTWGGITAMPSMHLAITTVLALAAVRTHKWLALVVVPLGLVILLGSIHLGWHYAVDGYAGILGAGAIWWICGLFARWWLAQRAAFWDGEPERLA